MYKSFSSIWFRKTEFPTKAILGHIKTFQHSIFNSPKSSVVSGDRRANTFNAFPLSSALRWAPHVCLCHLCDIAYISNRWIYPSMLSFESSNGGSFWPFNGWKVSFSSWVVLSDLSNCNLCSSSSSSSFNCVQKSQILLSFMRRVCSRSLCYLTLSICNLNSRSSFSCRLSLFFSRSSRIPACQSLTKC